MIYSICDANNNLLKYAFKNKFIFNGVSLKERKKIVYSVKKKQSAKNLLKESIKQGFIGCSIIELTPNEILGEDLLQEKKSIKNLYSKSLHDIEFLKTLFKFDPKENIDRNEKCIKCEKLCKQSEMSIIFNCPLFTFKC